MYLITLFFKFLHVLCCLYFLINFIFTLSNSPRKIPIGILIWIAIKPIN